ncbi:hypothetical protein K7432_013303 [Basidiobolus ranarum]|uniref:Uncharacterized protein n=1 Tax=Basidiobolus ranarum TaxID=34480 RepID=A0ABR2VR14_9FUNG
MSTFSANLQSTGSEKPFKALSEDMVVERVASQDPVNLNVSAKDETKLKASLTELFKFATKLDWALMSVGLLAAIIAGAGMPLMTIIFGQMGNTYSEFNTQVRTGSITPDQVSSFRSEINKYSLYYVYLAIGILAASYIYMSTWVYTGERQTRRFRESYLAAVLRQDITWFDKLGGGEITTRITSDTHLVQDGISEKFPRSCSSVATFISAFVIAFTRSWKLTLALFCIIPIIAISTSVLSKCTGKFVKKSLDHYSVSGALAEEVISSIHTVTAFGQQKKLSKMYNKNLSNASKEGMKRVSISSASISINVLVVYTAYSLVFWYGGKLLNSNDIKVGDVFNVFFAVIIGSFSFGQTSLNIQVFVFAQAAAAKLFSTIYRVPSIDSASKEGIQVTEKTVGLIEVCNIHFAYPSRPELPIMKGINLTVKPGQTVALVGSSGSGKSTIFQLLERFYDPLEGAIYLDGRPIKSLNIHWLRRQIGLVSQEPTLFKCTIAENVAHGLIGTSFEHADQKKKMELIEQACKMSNAHSFIMALPNKYDTHVGERGFLLSGGQKQRIAIARAMIKDPRILLLDEATSALDTQSEAIVQQALNRASYGRTTIVIAHRLSTIRNADQIIVMERGQIVETGTHSSLLVAQGSYYKLVKLQKFGHQQAEATPPPEDQNIAPMSQDSELNRYTTNQSCLSLSSKRDIEEAVERKLSFSYICYRIFLLNKPELKFMICGLCGSIVSGAVYPAFAIIFAEVTNSLSIVGDDARRTHEINLWSLMFLIIAIVMCLAQMIQGTMFGISGERLTERIRAMSFSSILNQEIGWFDRDQNNTGALVSMLATDATDIRGVSGSTFGRILEILVNIIGGLMIGLAYGWKLTLVVMGCIPLLVGTGMVRMRMMNGYQQKTRAAYEHSAQLACEATSSIRTVASLTREDDVCKMYHAALEEPIKSGKKNAFESSFIFALSQAIVFLVNALGFWYGGRLQSTIDYSGIIPTQEYDQKHFFIVFIAIIVCSQSAGNALSYIPDLSKAKYAAATIIALLDRQSIIDPVKAQGDKVKSVVGHVIYRDVHFHYPTRPSVPVLCGLNLDILPGQFVALVGSSGCGKSTVISLAERFYDVLSGSIMIDGKDVRRMNVNDMRKHIAFVGQEPSLYDMSIKDNICFGLADRVPSQEEIEKAACDANIHDFITSLSQKYDTPLGNKGSQLSGGQKQRIAIARALIRQPKILLLDEATSALDAASEKIVQTALDNAAKGRTTIAVAHRLSTIKHADIIYVLKNGVVNEQGTHEELMERKGQYYSLAIQQDLKIS